MDSRDAAAVPTDEEGMIAVAAALAKDAAVLFQSQRYSECVEVLNQLLQKKEGDPKVLHNIAVAEFYHNGCSSPQELLASLSEVKKKSEELARTFGEKIEASGSAGNNMILGSKGQNSNILHLCGSNSLALPYADEFDTSVAVLNTGIVLYQLHDYAQALTVLEPLFRNIEPLDEATALLVCLLLLDCALACHEASKAADVIQYMEKPSGASLLPINQGDTGNLVHSFSNHGTRAFPANNLAAAPDVSGLDSSLVVSDDALGRTLSDDGLEYETLLSALDISGTTLTKTSYDVSKIAAATDLKLKLHLYKVRFFLVTRNLKAAKREAKLAMNVARSTDSSTALLVKSQLEYARGHYPKAIKLLMTSSNRTESAGESVLNNNLGCIYYQLGKYNTSNLFFSKALRNCSTLRLENPSKLSTFSQDKSLLITYNCGLQYMACGKPLMAAQCFHKANLIFHDKPVLWLRLAECCLSALEKGLIESARALSTNEEVKVRVVGSGIWRNLVLEGLDIRNSNSGSSSLDGEFIVNNKLELSLPLARCCLLNALYLINKSETEVSKSNTLTVGSEGSDLDQISGGSKDSGLDMGFTAIDEAKEVKVGSVLNPALKSSVVAYEDLCRKEKRIMKQAVLVDLAYVELCLENPVKALSAAKTLLELQDCSNIFDFLGRIYAAEALCLLNRPGEAKDQLAVFVMAGNTVELPYGDENGGNGLKRRVEKTGEFEEINGGGAANGSEDPSQSLLMSLTPEQACAVLYVNLAMLATLRGDHEEASELVTKGLAALPNNPKAILTAVYIDLVRGRTQDAISKLKEHRSVRFFGAKGQ